MDNAKINNYWGLSKMKIFKTMSILLMLVCVFVVSAYAANLQSDITISTKVDGDSIEEGAVTRVRFQRGDTIDVEVRLNSSMNLSNVELLAMISGYEFNNMEPMSSASNIFDMESGVTYKKRLSIRVPVGVQQDDYLLRVIISDRYNNIATYGYKLKLDSPRRGFYIEDVVFSPGYVVEAGRALLTTVRVENKGQMDEKSVKVTVSIPELEISASDFIDKIKFEDSETSEEMYLRIPTCAKPGDYQAVIEVRYNQLREAIHENAIIRVVEGDSCVLPSQTAEAPKTVIALGATDQELEVGKAGALYPLTITNKGSESKTYTVSVEGTDGFASVQINPASTFVLGADDSQAVFVYLTAADDAAEGRYVFTTTVKSGDEVLKQIPLTANVVEAEGKQTSEMSLRNAVEIGLIVLVVILVILGIIAVVSRMKKDEGNDEEDDEVEGKTYY
jgi:uncharacterized membrane protein